MAETVWTTKDFVMQVIDPALLALGIDTAETMPAVRQLMLGTGLQESLLKHLRQLPNRDGTRGPALGYFQMEPATHDDIWLTYLAFRKPLAARVLRLAGSAQDRPQATLMLTNPVYAAAMARLRYRRAPEKLPGAGDLPAIAAYWKAHYNTPQGKGRPADFAAKLAVALG